MGKGWKTLSTFLKKTFIFNEKWLCEKGHTCLIITVLEQGKPYCFKKSTVFISKNSEEPIKKYAGCQVVGMTALLWCQVSSRFGA